MTKKASLSNQSTFFLKTSFSSDSSVNCIWTLYNIEWFLVVWSKWKDTFFWFFWKAIDLRFIILEKKTYDLLQPVPVAHRSFKMYLVFEMFTFSIWTLLSYFIWFITRLIDIFSNFKLPWLYLIDDHSFGFVFFRGNPTDFLTLFYFLPLLKKDGSFPMGVNRSNRNELLDLTFRYGMEPNRTSDFLLIYYK